MNPDGFSSQRSLGTHSADVWLAVNLQTRRMLSTTDAVLRDAGIDSAVFDTDSCDVHVAVNGTFAAHIVTWRVENVLTITTEETERIFRHTGIHTGNEKIFPENRKRISSVVAAVFPPSENGATTFSFSLLTNHRNSCKSVSH